MAFTVPLAIFISIAFYINQIVAALKKSIGKNANDGNGEKEEELMQLMKKQRKIGSAVQRRVWFSGREKKIAGGVEV